jgi:antitoxin HicB
MTWLGRSIESSSLVLSSNYPMNLRYSLLIQWSDEDQLYSVTLPEFAEIAMQPSTYGHTYEDAVKNAQEAIEGYLAYCEEDGLAIPTPNLLQVA